MKKLKIILIIPFLLASLAGKAQNTDFMALPQRVAQLGQLWQQVQNTSKIYNQNKEWFDDLKKVSSTIENFKKAKKTLELAQDIAMIYKNNMVKFRADKNFSVSEILAIEQGYIKLIIQSKEMLDEIELGVKVSGLKLTDMDRYNIINNVYKELKDHKALVEYYTQKQINVSWMRARQKGETERVLRHYGLIVN